MSRNSEKYKTSRLYNTITHDKLSDNHHPEFYLKAINSGDLVQREFYLVRTTDCPNLAKSISQDYWSKIQVRWDGIDNSEVTNSPIDSDQFIDTVFNNLTKYSSIAMEILLIYSHGFNLGSLIPDKLLDDNRESVEVVTDLIISLGLVRSVPSVVPILINNILDIKGDEYVNKTIYNYRDIASHMAKIGDLVGLNLRVRNR